MLGIVSTAVALFIQLLITCSLRFAASRPVQLLCLFFVALATGSMLSGAIVYGVEYCESASRCSYSYWLSAIAAVLVFEATSTIKSSTRPVATVKPLVQQPVSHCSPRLQRDLNIQGGVVERLLRLVICVRGPRPLRKFFLETAARRHGWCSMLSIRPPNDICAMKGTRAGQPDDARCRTTVRGNNGASVAMDFCDWICELRFVQPFNVAQTLRV